ncbi:MAG: aminotransferase class I/II-fold pyridoxal phosphate-dependent enzyme [Oscillospiraceae bacterium]|nr:aminotransferase class I/II-fold pyridoxal phosphate-dependent enzyme [Oscillospiraceae bacterium]
MDYSSLLSEAAVSLKPSGIRKFFDILAEKKDAISLGIGEPDFITPWHIRDAGIYSLEKGFTKYSSNAGMTELRQEVSKYLNRRFELKYDPLNQMLITVGGSEAIDLAIRATVNPGDEVIIPVPSFVCYGPITTMAHGVPVYVETKAENEFRLTPEELKAVITPKTKLLVLPFPNNPTGAIMEREHLEALAEVLRGTNILVLSDEIYAELSYGRKHVSMANIPDMYERTILVNGFSKCYAMTGWRMGYVCAHADIVAQMYKIHQYCLMCAPTVSQYAAIEALRNGDADIAMMRGEYDRRRKYLLEGLRELGLSCFEPRGAFYAFPSIQSTGLSSEEFCERFLMEKSVAVIPGTAFGKGGEGFVRICYASSIERITEALSRMREFLKTI